VVVRHEADPGRVAPAESLVARVGRHGPRTAIIDPGGTWSYDDVAGRAASLARALLDGRADLGERRVALLCTPGHEFVEAALACWSAGGVAVPIHPVHPDAELDYAIADSGADVIVHSPEHGDLARRLAGPHGSTAVAVTANGTTGALPTVVPERRAMMVYTSGTTGRPKGVVHTHRSVTAQVESLVRAWAWSAEDRILLVLPLHHVHGIVNVTLCALWAGAICEAPGGFDAEATWDRLASGALSLFMAVPTIYTRLLRAWEEADAAQRAAWSAGASRARLMVSGSAALPVSTLEQWETITGQVLLERYGMTELGMALSNTLERRVPGHVGEPLPGVEVRVVDDTGRDVPDGQPAELLVRGPQVFVEYWRRPAETSAAFVNGWFRTGDVAVHEPEGYRLLGRSSVDIIKTGGEKVSALEIEEVYRGHPGVVDCAVVGVTDPEWGERVCAAVELSGSSALTAGELRAWGKKRLAAHKVPSRFELVDELPRNAMGKVTKPDVARLFA
jgi:malonyl-CoA/methylmalonyl-CoA synthetase